MVARSEERAFGEALSRPGPVHRHTLTGATVAYLLDLAVEYDPWATRACAFAKEGLTDVEVALTVQRRIQGGATARVDPECEWT